MFTNLLSTYFKPAFFGSCRSYSTQQAVIIGAGLSGLSAAIRLRNLGFKKVLILEKRSRAGGPCGFMNIDGHNFELSTQMGRGALTLLQDLGINPKVENIANELFYSDGTLITTPFNTKSMWNLLYPKSILKFTLQMAVSQDSEKLSSALTGLNPEFRQRVLAMFAYPSARPDVTVGRVRKFLQDTGGHSSPFIIQDGIGSIVKNMESRIEELGGKIKFNQECVKITRTLNGQQLITTKDHQYKADLVISSSAWGNYPSPTKQGLPLISLFCEMDTTYNHPSGIHTTAFFPSNVETLFEQLVSGNNLPKELAFHCFPNKLPGKQKAVTIFALTPYGTKDVDKETKKHIVKYVLKQINKRFPQFSRQIKQVRCFSPREFEQQFGLFSHAPTFIVPEGFVPPTYDPKTGIYFIGDSTCTSNPNIFGALSSAAKRIEEIGKRHNLDLERSFSLNKCATVSNL